jgi:hypothetical protein
MVVGRPLGPDRSGSTDDEGDKCPWGGEPGAVGGRDEVPATAGTRLADRRKHGPLRLRRSDGGGIARRSLLGMNIPLAEIPRAPDRLPTTSRMFLYRMYANAVNGKDATCVLRRRNAALDTSKS